jgi:hypothetical protein
MGVIFGYRVYIISHNYKRSGMVIRKKPGKASKKTKADLAIQLWMKGELSRDDCQARINMIYGKIPIFGEWKSWKERWKEKKELLKKGMS